MNTEHPFPCLGQGQPWDFLLFHATTLSCLCCFCVMISTPKSNWGALSGLQLVSNYSLKLNLAAFSQIEAEFFFSAQETVYVKGKGHAQRRKCRWPALCLPSRDQWFTGLWLSIRLIVCVPAQPNVGMPTLGKSRTMLI